MRLDLETGIIVLSHLRWDFVYQRPQHVLSRLARKRRVLFIEEPIFRDSPPGCELVNVQRNVLVCRCHTPISAPGFSDEQISCIAPLVQVVIREQDFGRHVLWFYTPLPFGLAQLLHPQLVVYDCMDELSAFLNAPPELVPREERLLQTADLVFTGGPSLYRSKQKRNAHVYCFPSSIDVQHFARSLGAVDDPADQAGIPHARLGYCGVIDERFDASLLDQIATVRPDWHFVMLGPVVKIRPESLPRRPNIHYLGARSYEVLPVYLKGWDVCLLPFARNESTRFISPTKTLEYMAAGKPIVSTSIADVVELYGAALEFADSPGAFINACEQALSAREPAGAVKTARQRILCNTSWDQVANSMELLIQDALHRREQKQSNRPLVPPTAPRRPNKAKRRLLKSPVVIIGAGPTGLSAAYHVGKDALLLEQNATVGGLCRSIQVDGFTFDHAGHIMFSNDRYVHEMYKMLLRDNVHWQDREAWIFSKGVHTRYPFQGALYGLPPKVIKECVMGAIEAHFGKIKHGGSNGSAAEFRTGTTDSGGERAARYLSHPPVPGNGHRELIDCCADGVAGFEKSSGPEPACDAPAGEPRNFEEFINRIWGAGIAKHFAIPYNRKLWTVPLDTIETSWLTGRVPLPDLEEMIEGALQPVPKPMGPNARFGYPLRGGFQALMDGFLPHLRKRLLLNAQVSSINPDSRSLILGNGCEVVYDHLISTMPLPVLVGLMNGAVPSDVRKAAAALQHVSVRCVHIGVGREHLTDKHWIYYPESTVFHRIFVQGNASPYCNPPGGFGLTCEITYSEHKPLPCDGEGLIQRCINDCIEVGLFKREDRVRVAFQVDLPYAYVIYDHKRTHHVALIRSWLAENRVLVAGRYAEWEYYNSDHAFIAGKKAAEQVMQLQAEERRAPALPRLSPVVETVG